jgi:DNA-binding NarL/FixJ family response regulator
MSDQVNRIRVVLADDHDLFRGQMRSLLEKQADITVVAEADSGEGALSIIHAHSPDVAIIDLEMPGLDGFGVAKTLKREQAGVPVILLTAHKGDPLLRKAADLGFLGYMLKDDAVAELVTCIREVHAGRPYLSTHVTFSIAPPRNR